MVHKQSGDSQSPAAENALILEFSLFSMEKSYLGVTFSALKIYKVKNTKTLKNTQFVPS
jgi:hypothetical protein